MLRTNTIANNTNADDAQLCAAFKHTYRRCYDSFPFDAYRAKVDEGSFRRWDISLLASALRGVDRKLKKAKWLKDVLDVRNEVSHVDHMPDDKFGACCARVEAVFDAELADKSRPTIAEVLKNGSAAATETAEEAAAAAEEKRVYCSEKKTAGNDLFKRGEYDDAIEEWTEALQVGCDDAELLGTLYSNRSAAHFHREKWEAALSDGERACRVRPGWWRGYVRRGEALVALHRNKEALRHFERAVRLNPSLSTNPTFHDSLELCYIRAWPYRLTEEAEQLLDIAPLHRPSDLSPSALAQLLDTSNLNDRAHGFVLKGHCLLSSLQHEDEKEEERNVEALDHAAEKRNQAYRLFVAGANWGDVEGRLFQSLCMYTGTGVALNRQAALCKIKGIANDTSASQTVRIQHCIRIARRILSLEQNICS